MVFALTFSSIYYCCGFTIFFYIFIYPESYIGIIYVTINSVLKQILHNNKYSLFEYTN